MYGYSFSFAYLPLGSLFHRELALWPKQEFNSNNKLWVHACQKIVKADFH